MATEFGVGSKVHHSKVTIAATTTLPVVKASTNIVKNALQQTLFDDVADSEFPRCRAVCESLGLLMTECRNVDMNNHCNATFAQCHARVKQVQGL